MIKSLKIIVNADDCGISCDVDSQIEKYILMHKISSTTIMANMDDFDGAIRLYKKYSPNISFGIHLNLTEGKPLVYNQELLDKGLYIEHDKNLYFNVQKYRKHIASPSVQRALMKELCCQVEKVLDAGVKISHADSHHFIHTRILTLFLTPILCKKYGITKLRRMANYRKKDISFYLRQSWTHFMKLQYSAIKTTDFFTDYCTFLQNRSTPYVENGSTIELMCHPGGIYVEENDIIMNSDIEKGFNSLLINYNQL